jgi:hypothetical protein
MTIRMDVRILRISPICTDFFLSFRRKLSFLRNDKKKSVQIGEIREIRTSIRITRDTKGLKLKHTEAICGKYMSQITDTLVF